MEKIFDADDKIKLKRLCLYLNSLDLNEGTLDNDDFNDPNDIQFIDIDVKSWTHFSNSWNSKVPRFIYPVLEKILVAAQKKYDSLGIIEYPSDYANYGRIEITVDTINQDVTLTYWFSYYDVGEEYSITYDKDENEDEEFSRLFDSLEEVDGAEPIMILRYAGNSDSGYIESYFEEGPSVPDYIENWCYSELEQFPGWEINEGSQGEFIFDLGNKIITFNHTMNIEETNTITLFEEDFSR